MALPEKCRNASPKASGNAVPGKTAAMGGNQAKLPNTGMRSGGNTGKELEVDQGDSRGVSIPICPQNTENGLCFPVGAGGVVGTRGRRVGE